MTWHTGCRPAWRDEPAKTPGWCWLIVRGPDDPERRPRYKGQSRSPHQKMNKRAPLCLATRILIVLARGAEVTFNTISIQAFDLGADITWDSPLEVALWQLVTDRRVEWSARDVVYSATKYREEHTGAVTVFRSRETWAFSLRDDAGRLEPGRVASGEQGWLF